MNNDDYIKRKDIYNHMFALYKTADICGFDVTEELVLKSIEYAVAEDVKPVVHGKWILDGAYHKCSECDDYAPYYEDGEERLSYFCPFCGADMRKNDGNE